MNKQEVLVSVIYKNKHRIPVNKQAVCEFFYDHETQTKVFSGVAQDYNVNMRHFKKATEKLRESSFDDLPITLVDYERICVSIMRSKNSLPYKYKKLLRVICRIACCNNKLAMVVAKKMESERFIRIIGEYVEYFI